ncbi:hypothetical protein F2P81_021067 [Scophthalmus maximus]|uniref:Uncharacterized protein n=1 Tax=Scophthalmus maximus TaxID=52904 RepID=A0A6A4S3X2_SCOMX|nr:hypothetical protein F2P81_021067 [Scophthalmus maximus]
MGSATVGSLTTAASSPSAWEFFLPHIESVKEKGPVFFNGIHLTLSDSTLEWAALSVIDVEDLINVDFVKRRAPAPERRCRVRDGPGNKVLTADFSGTKRRHETFQRAVISKAI